MASWTPERVAELRRFRDRGLSSSQIAKELGVTRNAICGMFFRLGLSAPRPKRLRCAAALPVVAMPIDPVDIPVLQRKTLMQLTTATCKWPVGDPATVDFFFCGGAVLEGRPYCAAHARLAYETPLERRRARSAAPAFANVVAVVGRP